MSHVTAETPLTPLQIVRRENNARRFWVCVIVGFFAIDFTIAALAISMAAGDPSFRSIPGYGERALAWDIRQQRKQAAHELNWQVDMQRSEPNHDGIDLTIRDLHGQPVSGCSGTYKLFHFTRVAEQLRGEWTEIEPGKYRAAVDVSKSGLWQMELDLKGSQGQPYWLEQSLDWVGHQERELTK